MAWASNSAADKNDIPVTMQVADMSNDGAASWSMGFPSQTSLSQGQGGYYVARQDINGALNTLSQFALYAQSGAVYNWSASVDYATGAHVRGSDGVEYIAVANSGPDVSSAVNPTTDVNYTTWKPYLRSIADFIYPVGSIYMSVNDTSPAVLFGGVWQRIQGRFLLGSSSSYAVGSTGGAATKTLTVNNLPAHNHVATTADAGGHVHTATNANNGAHTHTVTVNNSGAHTHTTSGTAASAGAHTHNISITAGAQSAGAHTHGVTYAATTVSATAASNGAHTHSVTFPKTTLTSTSAGSHTHERGTLNITGTFDADDLNNDTTTPTATGAFGYKRSTTRRDAENGSSHGYAITFNAKNGWEGSLASNGAHTHSITIAATAMTTASAGAHTHSVSVAIPKKDMTTASAGAHTHNLSGATASAGAHTHTVSGTAASAGTHNHDASTASAGSHTHTITVQTAGVHQHAVTVNNTGGNTAFSLLPPYFTVNIWQRTA
jgi:microcystin-dependent protein